MTKIFIENLNREAPAEVRIYRLDKNELTLPDIFTPMDTIGGSFGIILKPSLYDISCDGSLNRTPEINIEGPVAFAMGNDGDFINCTSPEELVTALEQAGLVVEIVPDNGLD